MAESDKVFAGLIPELYDTLMVPLIFEAYAADLAQRVAAFSPGSVLETAAGSGVVTRALAPRLGVAATAYCQGTPLRSEIEARDASLLQLATDRATQAIASRHGNGPVAGKIQAHVVVATR